jgi:uncharacterized membrane protein YgdD (TMEM256/DUF423 family)
MNISFSLFGAVLGFFGVLAGAFGAHGLDGILVERGTRLAWETAVVFHLLHAVAISALGWSCGPVSWKSLSGFTAIAWTGGVVFFSGSIYVLSTGGPRFLGPVTPLGGLLLLIGWLLALFHGMRQKNGGS